MNIRIIAVAAMLAGFGGAAFAEEIKINTTEVDGRLRDDFSNLSFVNDPAVLGKWVSVDFVSEPSEFVPGEKHFEGSLYLEGLTFLPKGKTPQPWFGWTKGVVMHLGGDHTASRYTIKEISGAKYMFFEWKSGDYIIRHQKPQYYVLKKK
jgi:bla regulator protein BlaR1